MGAWIEIFIASSTSSISPSRTPRWVRGLKFCKCITIKINVMSHPTMGAWIEIQEVQCRRKISQRRTPRWVRGLKSYNSCTFQNLQRRTPRWVRGLKLVIDDLGIERNTSHPTMGAWIEILLIVLLISHLIVAPHDGCVD